MAKNRRDGQKQDNPQRKINSSAGMSEPIREHAARLSRILEEMMLTPVKGEYTFTLPPEVREWALQQHTEEEIVAGLKDVRDHGGADLADVIRELEHGTHDRESSKSRPPTLPCQPLRAGTR